MEEFHNIDVSFGVQDELKKYLLNIVLKIHHSECLRYIVSLREIIIRNLRYLIQSSHRVNVFKDNWCFAYRSINTEATKEQDKCSKPYEHGKSNKEYVIKCGQLRWGYSGENYQFYNSSRTKGWNPLLDCNNKWRFYNKIDIPENLLCSL